jgi:hypothetical protein
MTRPNPDAFQVIADPGGRQMLKLLSVNSLTINSFAENFGLYFYPEHRPGKVLHIKKKMALTNCRNG